MRRAPCRGAPPPITAVTTFKTAKAIGIERRSKIVAKTERVREIETPSG